ncbi:MAG: preprotein translocase subunit SecG, partial [Beijerinckiaceae bacterium]
MQNVLIIVHLLVVLALIGVVLLQRSEGGGLGLGGGSSGVSGFLTGRGQANALTRATTILAAAFFVTSILLTMLQTYGRKPVSILDGAPAGVTTPAP